MAPPLLGGTVNLRGLPWELGSVPGESVEHAARGALQDVGGSQDENPVVGCDHRARWLLHDNPHWRRGVRRVQGLMVQLGANGHRAWMRGEAGVPVVDTASASRRKGSACSSKH